LVLGKLILVKVAITLNKVLVTHYQSFKILINKKNTNSSQFPPICYSYVWPP